LVKITRRWLRAALAPVTFGAGAALIVGTLAGRPPSPHHGSSQRLSAAVQSYRSRRPTVLDCLGHSQVRPASLTLSCADGNSSLTGLHWRSWQSSAYGEGTWLINDCVPYCARGTVHRYPVVVVLWAPERLGQRVPARDYSKLTMILPSGRCYTAGGKRACYPAMSTRVLRTAHQPPPVMSIQMSLVPLPAAVATRHQASRGHLPPRTLAAVRRPASRTVRAYRPRGGGESLPGKILVARPSGIFPGRGLVPDAGPPAPGTPSTRGLARPGPDAAQHGGFLGGQHASELPGPRSVHGR
jgi:hypothetical protein